MEQNNGRFSWNSGTKCFLRHLRASERIACKLLDIQRQLILEKKHVFLELISQEGISTTWTVHVGVFVRTPPLRKMSIGELQLNSDQPKCVQISVSTTLHQGCSDPKTTVKNRVYRYVHHILLHKPVCRKRGAAKWQGNWDIPLLTWSGMCWDTHALNMCEEKACLQCASTKRQAAIRQPQQLHNDDKFKLKMRKWMRMSKPKMWFG